MKNILRIFTTITLFGLMFISANAQDLKGSWHLIEITADGEKVIFEEEIRTMMSFGEKNGFGGDSGCNRYSASYKLIHEKIEFSAILSTKMACAGDRMKQENMFFSTIRKTDLYKFEGDHLIFYDKSSRNVLKFEPVFKTMPVDEKPAHKC